MMMMLLSDEDYNSIDLMDLDHVCYYYDYSRFWQLVKYKLELHNYSDDENDTVLLKYSEYFYHCSFQNNLEIFSNVFQWLYHVE